MYVLYVMSDITTWKPVCFSPGSVPSLAAGLLFGGLAGLGAYQLSQDPRNVWVFLGRFASGSAAAFSGGRGWQVLSSGFSAASAKQRVGFIMERTPVVSLLYT